MDRLTRPGVDAEQTAVRFMDNEVKIQAIGDKLMDLILNGPTINGVNKDTLRHILRQLYAALKLYEDLDLTPDEIEQQLMNYSSFLMEMTGGRMSKTNYTVQAMVSEANDYQQKLTEEDMREFAADVAHQFGYHTQHNGRLALSHGGLSTLEWAFEILGWENPHPDPENECQYEGCHHYASCGTPTKDGYKRVCGHHFAVIQANDRAEAALAKDNNVPTKKEEVN